MEGKMPPISLFDRTTALLERAMDLRMQNQQGISANIANVDTPGYRAVHLEFEESLKRALAVAEAGVLPTSVADGSPGQGVSFDNVTARVVRTDATGTIGDQNSVNLDEEMIALAENQMLYEAATQMITKKLGLLRYVIQEVK